MANDSDSYSHDFIPVLESIFTEANAELINAPDVLYHYTDAKGLLGILESGKFQALHYRFLNDCTEMNYAVPTIIEELKKIRKTLSDTTIRSALSQVDDTQQCIDSVEECTPLDIFVASFSNEINMSTQWEMYADNGNGFALGIDPKATHYYDEFLIDLRPYKSPKYYLVKVLYDEELQRKIITTAFTTLINFIQEHTEPGISENVIMKNIQALIILLSLLCKNKSFEYENEWRFIHCRNPFPLFQLNLKDEDQKDNYISFRCRNNTIIPYANLDFRKEAAVPQAFDYDPNLKLIPLEKIIIGPRQNDYNNVKRALKNLLTAQGYDVPSDLIEKCTIEK